MDTKHARPINTHLATMLQDKSSVLAELASRFIINARPLSTPNNLNGEVANDRLKGRASRRTSAILGMASQQALSRPERSLDADNLRSKLEGSSS